METKQTYRVGQYYLTRNRSGTWCRTWYDAKTQQRRSASLGTEDFQEAQQRLNDWFVSTQTPVLDENLELSRCFIEYWEQHAKRLARHDAERRNSVYWLEFFPGALVREIRPPEQRKFIRHLQAKGFAKATIEGIFKTGSAAINWAWRNDMLLKQLPMIAPAKELTGHKEAKGERWRPLEVDEIAAMFNHSDREQLTRFLMIALGCACRPSAAIELSGEQIDLQAGTIDLLRPGEAQTNKHRPVVRLPWFIWAIHHPKNLVTQSPRIACLNNLRNREWRRARDAAGLDELVTPYSLRHTIARHLRASGVQPWHTSAQLGHRRRGSEITEIYAPHDPSYLDDAVVAIEEHFEEVLKRSPTLKVYLDSLRARCVSCE